MVSAKAIPPGGETQIKASVNTKNRRGELRKSVTVVSNDPETPRLSLTLEAQVISDLILTPPSVSFGQLGKGEKAERELSVRPSDPRKIRIVSARIDDKRFALRIKSRRAETTSYAIRFLGSAQLQPIYAALEIQYEGADESLMRVPVMAWVVGDLIYLKQIYFTKRAGAFTSREINFSSRSSKPIKLISAKDPAGLLKLTIVESSGRRPTLRAELANPDASYTTTKRGTITVKTNSRDEPTVQIGYSIAEQKTNATNRSITPAARSAIPAVR